MNVVRKGVRHLNGRHNVGLRSDHDVGLEPLRHRHFAPVLGAVPTAVFGRRESRRIDREIRFDGLQRFCALRNHRVEDGCQNRVFEHVENRVVVWSAVNVAFGCEVAQVGHRASARGPAVHLHGRTEYHVRDRQARTSPTLYRVVDSGANVVEQRSDALFFVDLSAVISAPRLRVRDLDGFRHRRFALAVRLAQDCVFNRKDVLALTAVRFVIGTGARRLLASFDDVATARILRWDDPQVALTVELLRGGNDDAAFLSRFHIGILPQGKFQVNTLTVYTIAYMLCRWRRFNCGGIAASGAITNGCRETRIEIRKYVRIAKARIGIVQSKMQLRMQLEASNDTLIYFEMTK